MIIGHPRRIDKVEFSDLLNLNDSEIKRVVKTKSLGGGSGYMINGHPLRIYETACMAYKSINDLADKNARLPV